MTRGSNVKKKFVLAALVAAAIQVPAMAGFVDMTVPGGHPYSNASQVRVIIDDAYQTPQWDQPIAPQNSYVSLPEALAILLPRDLPGMRVHMDPSLEGLRVNWDTGLTRRQALASALPPGMVLKISGGSIHVSRVVEMEMPSRGQMLGGSGSYVVRLADKTVRQTLARWAQQTGWAFEDAYWAVDRDIPVVAASSFTGNFKDAVLGLLATTEVTDLPAKPCFYTNNVVRVVPKAEKCDKTKQE